MVLALTPIHAKTQDSTKKAAPHLQIVWPCEEPVLRAGHDGFVVVLPQQGDLLHAHCMPSSNAQTKQRLTLRCVQQNLPNGGCKRKLSCSSASSVVWYKAHVLQVKLARRFTRPGCLITRPRECEARSAVATAPEGCKHVVRCQGFGRTYPDNGPFCAHSSTLTMRAISFSRSRVGVLSASCLLPAIVTPLRRWARCLGSAALACCGCARQHAMQSRCTALVVHKSPQQSERGLVGHVFRRPAIRQAEVIHQARTLPIG